MRHPTENFWVTVFRDSVGPFGQLLKEYEVEYRNVSALSSAPMAANQWIEIAQSAAMWGALATVIVQYLKQRSSRKVIITTKDNVTIQAENLTHDELEQVLQYAKDVAVIDTKPQKVLPVEVPN